jgi:hypothetical protein
MVEFSTFTIGETGTIRAFRCEEPQKDQYLLFILTALLGLITILYLSLWPLFIIFFLYHTYKSQTVVETLYVIKNLGIQITRTNRGGVDKSIFIQANRIRELVINEGLTPYDVKYYVAIIVSDASELVLPFEVSFILEIYFKSAAG